ncbi:MAG: hypothetical protein QME61_00515 [Patescibacteria group bacterium]|nr:hypothetical protein [Patescibacteria group bacterium]
MLGSLLPLLFLSAAVICLIEAVVWIRMIPKIRRYLEVGYWHTIGPLLVWSVAIVTAIILFLETA